MNIREHFALITFPIVNIWGRMTNMDKKKINFGKVADVGKTATSMLGKAKKSVIKAIDQNEDGEFNLKDVEVIAENLGSAAKATAGAIKTTAEAKNRDVAIRTLQPIFADDLDSADFMMSKLLRITEMDKKRAASAVCQGSIGYVSTEKELRIINIFHDSLEAFGLTFYPDTESEIYYVDPSDRNRYIALDDYFGYLKEARVNELQKIAQDLGAKHFCVTYKEQKTIFSGKTQKMKGATKAYKGRIEFDSEQDLDASEVSTVEIAAEMDCPGHLPIAPDLRFLQREPSIQTLISLRMDENSPITHQKYTLKLINSSGIKEKDAIKIDAALKAMKFTGNTTVTNEVKNEARRFFEYEIDF